MVNRPPSLLTGMGSDKSVKPATHAGTITIQTEDIAVQYRRVDPRTLIANPNNPRRTAVNPVYDQQLTASILETGGPLQPPIVREHADGALTIVAGHRRVACAISAELAEIDVFVRDASASGDSMAAFAENMVRTGMCSVDIWRAIEAFIGEGYTEQGISTALSIPVRDIRRLRLFANVLPAMLDRMAQGDEPEARQLRTIASATREDQAVAWKKHKPKKTESTTWHMIESALRKSRIGASAAVFDDTYAQAHGVIWTEDLFAEGDKDPRYTDQVEAFMAAQLAWVTDHLPPNGEMLDLTQWGEAKLPPKAELAYGSDKKRKDVRIGFWVERHSGAVRETYFSYPRAAARSATGAEADAATGRGMKTPRADISGKGQELIGQYRTDALKQALAEGEIDDGRLIGLLVLALSGNNVMVQQDQRHYRIATHRDVHARAISNGGIITEDMQTLRAAARAVLGEVLSCKLGADGSGQIARIAGASIQADVYLPNMATEDFLPKLSKDGITKALQAQSLLPRNTGKQMRKVLIEHVGTGSYVHPAALFDLTEDERVDLDARIAADRDPETNAPDHETDDEVDNEHDDRDLEAFPEPAGEIAA